MFIYSKEHKENGKRQNQELMRYGMAKINNHTTPHLQKTKSRIP
jgi:hypothetical protein